MENTLIKIEGFELNELYKSFPGVIISIKVNLDFSEECLFISDNCEAYFGYSSKELMTDWDFFLNNISKHDKSFFKTEFEQALNSSKRIAAVGRYKTKSNETKWLKFNANIIDNKTHYIMQGVYIDITEEKNRELKEDKLKDSLILLARHPYIYNGNIKNIGKLCVQLITETLDVSRSGFWLYKTEFITCDKLYIKSSEQIIEGLSLNQNEFPDFFKAIANEPYIIANDALNHIATKCLNDSYLAKNNISSLLIVPVIHNNSIIAILSQEQVGQKRNWQKLEVNFLFQVAELISFCFALHERNEFEEEQKKTIEELTELTKKLRYELLK